MKRFIHFTPHRCIHPVATLYPSTETGNFNTPLELLPFSNHKTTHDIQFRMMTTRTKMTKVLSVSKLLLWPKGHCSLPVSGHCLCACGHLQSCQACPFIHEMGTLKRFCQDVRILFLRALVDYLHFSVVHALLGAILQDCYVPRVQYILKIIVGGNFYLRRKPAKISSTKIFSTKMQ
jgi:hypothetical protein